jgi:penicillin-binding protein 1A
VKVLLRWTARLASIFFLLAIIGICTVFAAIWYYGRDLPDYRTLADYEPPVVTRVYAGNGLLIGEFANERRVFVPIKAIPMKVRNAFLAAEDKTFYEHPGIDLPGIASAALTYIRNIGTHRRPVGASTITQQVAKNFLLSNKVSIERKIKEMILAFRIEHTFSKDQILELYLNEISLGARSFGVAAAALSYFNKSLDELTIAEAAYLAALPKAPSRYSRHAKAAIARRNWIIGQMLANGFIKKDEAEAAMKEPLVKRKWDPTGDVPAAFFVEDVRRELLKKYGEEHLAKGGFAVRTTLNPSYQKYAYHALRAGLVAYDRRHGWRGPLANVPPGDDWAKTLDAFADGKLDQHPPHPNALGDWQLAMVLALDDAGRDKHATIGLKDGTKGTIPLAELEWARERRPEQRLGAHVKKPSDVLKVGDIVAVEPVTKPKKGKPYPKGTYGLRQIPAVQGGLVAIDPHTGRVLAMVGGYAFGVSHYNRATQARRQPGSAFKPFVYLTAMDNGYTPSSIILDAPAVIGNYKPSNYDGKYLGMLPLRRGLELSRNTMTVRLAQAIGIEPIAETAEKFGVGKDLPREYSMTLGAVETTVLDLTTAYAMLANGGKRITPTLIDRIQDRYGRTLLRHDERPCPDCQNVAFTDQDMPVIKDTREQLDDPRSVYQVVSMLEGVVNHGTGVTVKVVGKPLAGKTGTTNDFIDAWFVGFTPNLAVGVWVGFDRPQTLGYGETGGRVAAPIFRDFMLKALKDKPAVSFRVPPGLTMVRVNHRTGARAKPGDKQVILEAFKDGTQPGAPGAAKETRGLVRKTAPESGTGGLY